MASGVVFTVTTAVRLHPVDVCVWVMMVVPAFTPVSVVVVPAPDTVAIVPLLLIHGPVPLDESVDVPPSQTDNVPVMVAGKLFTVTSTSE
jgi:hypothetical protein